MALVAYNEKSLGAKSGVAVGHAQAIFDESKQFIPGGCGPDVLQHPERLAGDNAGWRFEAMGRWFQQGRATTVVSGCLTSNRTSHCFMRAPGPRVDRGNTATWSGGHTSVRIS